MIYIFPKNTDPRDLLFSWFICDPPPTSTLDSLIRDTDRYKCDGLTKTFGSGQTLAIGTQVVNI